MLCTDFVLVQILKSQVALKVSQMKVARHNEALRRARAAKTNPSQDPVLLFLQSKSPQALSNAPYAPVLNATAPVLGLGSQMTGLGICDGDATDDYEDNMLKDPVWDD